MDQPHTASVGRDNSSQSYITNNLILSSISTTAPGFTSTIILFITLAVSFSSVNSYCNIKHKCVPEDAVKTKFPFWARCYLGNDACLALLLLAHHGVGFPSPSLAIGKDAHVVALKGVQEHLLANIIVHTALRCKAGIFRLQRHKQHKYRLTPSLE